MARPDEHDTSRRDFFRAFGRETVRQAGAVAGVAAELRRSSMAAARVLFDADAPSGSAALDMADLPVSEIDATRPDATFRSAYRFTGTEIIALDARQLPQRVATVALSQPSEVASAIRAGAINGGPVLAEVGAYALALVARTAMTRSVTGRVQQMRAAAAALRAARPQIHALTWAVDRLENLYLELVGQATDPTQAAGGLASEADSIASAAAAAQAHIGRSGAGAILAGSNHALDLLLIGDMGPLSCGLVGMGTSLIGELRDAGREVHVWLTDGGPDGEGSRVTAFTLRQLDVPFSVIPDAALGWLFDGRHIDALLLRGDRVALNGDCGVPLGGRTATLVAAAAGVPVYVLAPRNAFDGAAVDGTALRADPNPTNDVVTAEQISGLFSEAT